MFGWDTNVGRPIEPDQGSIFSQIDAEFCAAGDVGNISGVDVSFAFELETRDGFRISPESTSYRGDEMVMVDRILEGDCGRGFVVFQTPRGERPRAVLFAATDAVLRWEL